MYTTSICHYTSKLNFKSEFYLKDVIPKTRRFYFCVHFFRRSHLMMKLAAVSSTWYLYICCERIILFSGIFLNTLVILSFWRSVQHWKKLFYFIIMVLSCFDLLVVLTNHPLTALIAMLWLIGTLHDVYPSWVNISWS